jgi:hypothetical protein
MTWAWGTAFDKVVQPTRLQLYPRWQAFLVPKSHALSSSLVVVNLEKAVVSVIFKILLSRQVPP